jgi:hypothetical protein
VAGHVQALLMTLARRKPPTRIVLRSPDEHALESFVVTTAHLYGWCGWHVAFSKGAVTGVHALGKGDDHYDSDGWPDWVFVRGDRILFRELKGEGKYPDANQRRWGALLVAAGLDWKVWKPRDRDEIVSTFRGHAGVR